MTPTSSRRLVLVAIALVTSIAASTAQAGIIVTGSTSPGYNGSDDPWTTTNLTVGWSANGSVAISGSSAVKTGSLTLGTRAFLQNFGYSGNVTITGGGTVTNTIATFDYGSSASVGGGTGVSTWNNSGSLTLAYASLYINPGGSVSDTSASIAVPSGISHIFLTEADVYVNGGTWTNSGTLGVGGTFSGTSGGRGSLDIGGGGSVSDTAATIGPSNGTIGSVSLGGGSVISTWNNSGPLTVGVSSATATLSIYTGGVVSATALNGGNAMSSVQFYGGTLRITATDSASNTIQLLAGGGTLDVPTPGSTLTITSAMNGAGGLTKTGAGTLALTAANTYSGNTNVSGGTLKVSGSGSLAASRTISIASGAMLDVSAVTGGLNYDGARFSLVSGQTLKGTGTVVGSLGVAAGAEIDPGNSIGTLATGNLVFAAAASILRVEIDLGALLGADLLNVTGSITLGGSTLGLSILNAPTSYIPPQTFLIAANDGSDAVNGVFGSIIVPAGYRATVDYAYVGTDALGRVGDGNDVAVTVSAVPEPSALLLGTIAFAALSFIVTRRKAAGCHAHPA